MNQQNMGWLMDMSQQFVDVYKSPTGIFIGASNQSKRDIPPGLYGPQPYTTINAWDATTYYLNTTQQGFSGTNNPFGPRQLYNAGATDRL